MMVQAGAGTEYGSEESEWDWEDNLNKVMESRGKQKNLSFFAFTATPKGKTLELFGCKGSDSKPAAFHTYSMKKAIEEGFILYVLQRYTSYKTYFKIVKSVEDDPVMPKKKTQKKLGKFMALHPHNIEQIKEKASKDERIIQTAMTNPLDKFELGIKAIIESLIMQRMAENDEIVTRYMDDSSFQKTTLSILARAIYKSIPVQQE